ERHPNHLEYVYDDEDDTCEPEELDTEEELVVEEIEEHVLPEDTPSNDDVGYEEPRRLEDDDPLEEVRDDLETLQEEVAPRVEHESEQHHPIMVPPKIVSTLQSS
ncbi:hypothetical protein LINPERHAP2_LOCUS5886, partial [Linum perenne]